MRPTLDELERFMAHLADAVTGSVIEKVWRPTSTSILLEIRGLKALAAPAAATTDTASPTKKPRLYVDLEHGAPWVAVTTRWPDTPAAPDRETLELRKHLENRKIVAVAIEEDRRLHLALLGGDAFVVQLAGRYPQAGVSDEHGTTLCALLPTRALRDPDSPPLKPGKNELAGEPWLIAHGERAWAQHDERAQAKRLTELTTATRRALTKKRRLAKSLADDLHKTETRHTLAHTADLLATVLHRVPPKADTVEAADWTRDPPESVTIELDPSLSASKNLERLHTKRKKLERQHDALRPQLAQVDSAVAELSSLLATLEHAPSDSATLAAHEARLASLGADPTPQRSEAKSPSAERQPYRTFRALDGSEILIGRSAKDNDALTFKVARGSDIFLHARDVPGSHVILCHRKKGPPHPEALMDAAALAAWHSKLREDTLVDVLWTEKKHVRKVKGSAGLVQTAAARTLAVRRDPDRIERLYRTLGTIDESARRA